jgi:cysteinyl-tRNA synthetase
MEMSEATWASIREKIETGKKLTKRERECVLSYLPPSYWGDPEARLKRHAVDSAIKMVVSVRAVLRERGEYELSDSLRDQLDVLGVQIEEPASWRWAIL